MIRRLCLLALAATALVACGKPAKPAKPAAQEAAKAAPAAQAKAKPAADPKVDEKAVDRAATAPEPGKAVLTGSGAGALADAKVSLRFDPPSPKVGQLFKVITTLTRGGKPTSLTDFSVDSTMPHHGHGMMTKPQHKAQGPGVWVSEGFKLHMHGKWVFVVKGRLGADALEIKMPFEQPPEAL